MKNSSLLISLLLSGLLTIVSCSPNDSKTPSTDQPDPVNVGIVLPLTGKHAKFGEIEKLSFELALEKVNAEGGINGRPLKLIFEDTTGKPDIGRSAAEKLITQNEVVMLGGGYSSSVTAAIAGVAINKGFPFLVNTGSADIITEPTAHTPSGKKIDRLKKSNKSDDITTKIAELTKKAEKEAESILSRYAIFRLNPPVSEYANGIESFLAQVVKPQTAVILNENSLFGTKGAASFQKTCARLGVRVLLKESYDQGAIDFKPILAKVKDLDPDIVYMSSYVLDASLLMKQSMELGLNPKMFIGGGAGFTLPEFYTAAGKAAEKVISATLWHQSIPFPGAMEYYDDFAKRYNRETEYHGAEAYAATFVIADALRRAKSFSPEEIRDALLKTDMETIFGPVKFISYGAKVHQNRLPTYVVQWIDGKLTMIWPENLAKQKYVYPVNWPEERK